MNTRVIWLGMLCLFALPCSAETQLEANERAAVASCKAYVEAQEIYHRTDYTKEGILQYAQVIDGRADEPKGEAAEGAEAAKPDEKETAQIESSIGALKGEDAAAQEKAAADLIAFGSKALEQVTAASKAEDAAAAERATKVLNAIKAAGGSGMKVKMKWRFGLIGTDGKGELGLLDKGFGEAECLAGFDPAKSKPKAGYLFRILTRQGEKATGGKRDYVINNAMTLGYGLIAFPAEYGVSGKKCFIINYMGVIWDRDFGSKKATDDYAKDCVEFDPSQEWLAQ
jgi:hypothetical protein